MCTNLSIPVNSNEPYYVSARTMDFGTPFTTYLKKFRVGESFPKIPYPFVHRLEWEAKYGFIGTVIEFSVDRLENVFNIKGKILTDIFSKINIPLPGVWDGMNSEGLSIGTLWLPGTKYPSAKIFDRKDNHILMVNFPAWVLGNCAKVSDVQDALNNNKIQIHGFEGFETKLPLHFMIQDSTGDCLLIEFNGGKLVLTPKSQQKSGNQQLDGLLTNAPFYSEQLDNLNQEKYQNLTPQNTETYSYYPQQINGSGFLGLPGDATPPSRFVRAAKMCLSVYRPETENVPTQIENDQKAVGFAWQLLQNLMVPYGTITDMNDSSKLADYTQWSVIRDYTNMQYYFYSAFNPTLHKIDLKTLDFSTSSDAKVLLAPDDKSWCVDSTSKLN